MLVLEEVEIGLGQSLLDIKRFAVRGRVLDTGLHLNLKLVFEEGVFGLGHFLLDIDQKVDYPTLDRPNVCVLLQRIFHTRSYTRHRVTLALDRPNECGLIQEYTSTGDTLVIESE
jgi:hypothetical protein